MMRYLLPSIIVLTLAVGGSSIWLKSMRAPDDLRVADLATIEKVVDVQATDTAMVKDMTLGAEDAPVTIVEYASFTCPHCANFHKNVFPDLKKAYIETGKVRMIMRDVYFDRFGLWAAMVARCDGGNDKFFGISSLIYERQKEWTNGNSNAEIVGNLKKLGKIAGLEEATLDACLADNDKAQALVAAFQQNAERDNIDSTPSFIVNGEKQPNMSFADFKVLLDGLLGE